MTHSNHWETDGLYRQFTGHVTGDEILYSNLEIHADPRFQRIAYIINDFSGISSHAIDTSHTDVYAKTDDIVAATKGDLKIALVVTGAEQRSLAEAYRGQMRACRFDCEIFDNVDDARTWATSGTSGTVTEE